MRRIAQNKMNSKIFTALAVLLNLFILQACTPNEAPIPTETAEIVTPTASLAPSATTTPTTAPTATPEPTLTKAYKAGDLEIREQDGMEMVYVPAGSFEMGSDSEFNDEQPLRKITLDAFFIDKYEVSNGQYQKCLDAGACTEPGNLTTPSQESYFANPDFADYPVVYVDWAQAQGYCQWVGGDLPSEAQWEKAARGTDGRQFPWGNEGPDTHFTYGAEDFPVDYANFDDYEGDLMPVGSYPKGVSPFGALDMAGNVWEWTRDWYGDYEVKQSVNPEGPKSGTDKVVRGGSFDFGAWSIRTTYRGKQSPDYQNYRQGFRCITLP